MGVTIDVREYPEFASGHIAGAQLVSLGTLARASEGWSKHETLMLVCKSGRRAEQARQELTSRGFTSVSECFRSAGDTSTTTCKLFSPGLVASKSSRIARLLAVSPIELLVKRLRHHHRVSFMNVEAQTGAMPEDDEAVVVSLQATLSHLFWAFREADYQLLSQYLPGRHRPVLRFDL